MSEFPVSGGLNKMRMGDEWKFMNRVTLYVKMRVGCARQCVVGVTAAGVTSQVIGRSKDDVAGKRMDCGLMRVEHCRDKGSTFDLFKLNSPIAAGHVSNWCLHKALEVSAAGLGWAMSIHTVDVYVIPQRTLMVRVLHGPRRLYTFHYIYCDDVSFCPLSSA
jgi:hypothetical protein